MAPLGIRQGGKDILTCSKGTWPRSATHLTTHLCGLWPAALCSQPQFPVCQMGMATDLTGQGSLRL